MIRYNVPMCNLYTPKNNGWLVQNKYCIEFYTIYLFLITKSHISIQVYQVFNMVRCSNSWSSIYPALFVFPHCYLLVTLMSVVRCSNSWSSIYPAFVLPHHCSTVPTNGTSGPPQLGGFWFDTWATGPRGWGRRWEWLSSSACWWRASGSSETNQSVN